MDPLDKVRQLLDIMISSLLSVNLGGKRAFVIALGQFGTFIDLTKRQLPGLGPTLDDLETDATE